MNTVYLSEEQKQHWHDNGYLILKHVLSSTEVDDILNAVDTVIESYVRESTNFQGTRFGSGAFTIIRAIERTDALDLLTDHPNTFGKILSLMGPYLQIMGTQIYVRHPDENQLMGFHTDAGPSLQRIHPHPNSLPLQFKIQFFLTDLSHPNSANFMCVPGSHQKPFSNYNSVNSENPDGAIQITAEAGDAVIFPWALWHGVGPNHSDNIRKSVTFRYGQMWSRPYDYDSIPNDVLLRMTPRRQRLFGFMGENSHPTDYFKPKDQIEMICGNEWYINLDS
ncbi:phytanoyl-CoA dioxygenase family protein [Candidatus Poribacteria bacterium]|nr:phytanoyl-CoA dioxygenase family protein [Candidatus Poribacteria bacterium]